MKTAELFYLPSQQSQNPALEKHAQSQQLHTVATKFQLYPSTAPAISVSSDFTN